MKKFLLLISTSLFLAFSSTATEIRLNLYSAYVFDDKFSSVYSSYEYYEGKIIGGLQYGAGLEFMIRQDYGVELLYIGQNTTAPTYYNSNYLLEKYSVMDVNLNFAMIGGTRHIRKEGSKLEGYGGLMLGALFAGVKNPDTGGSRSGTKFAWGLRLGGNIWLSDRVALKMQGQLLSAVQSVGGSLYFGSGGAGAGVSTYSSMLQFSIGGGLAFNLSK